MSVEIVCSNPACKKRKRISRWRKNRARRPACSVECRIVIARTGHLVLRDGYAYRRIPHHPQADTQGFVAESILVAEQVLGRPLRQGIERVKRIGFFRDDNRPEHLVIVTPDGSWPVRDIARRERRAATS